MRTVLVAFLKNPSDLLVAERQGWYRIPVSTKNIPQNVKEKKLEYIAFYQPKNFGDDAYQVAKYAKVKNISFAKRSELFPDELSVQPDKLYYKIEFDTVENLSQPILSHLPRRILFIPTTKAKLFNAKEINDLFHESNLEEKLWRAFVESKIKAERQYFQHVKGRNYILDFAIFCKLGKIDVEVDGDHFHDNPKAVHYDKERDILLESQGWSVLRFHQDRIENKYKLNDSLARIREKIIHFHGIKFSTQSDNTIIPPDPMHPGLFDE